MNTGYVHLKLFLQKYNNIESSCSSTIEGCIVLLMVHFTVVHLAKLPGLRMEEGLLVTLL